MHSQIQVDDQLNQEQILQQPQAQQRIFHITQVLKNHAVDPEKWISFDTIETLLDKLYSQTFPIEILNLIQKEANQFIGNRMQVKSFINYWVLTEYRILQQIQQEKREIKSYYDETLLLNQKLEDAKKNQHLNEFGIDVDSKLYVTIKHAQGLFNSQYYVKMSACQQEQESDLSNLSSEPIWDESKEYILYNAHQYLYIYYSDIYTPHCQLIIQLYQQNQTKIGNLYLPLYNFKDQQHFEEAYVLEEDSGILGNTNRKLTIMTWWMHNKVALILDYIRVHQEKEKQIQQLKHDIKNKENQLQIMAVTFQEKKVESVQINCCEECILKCMEQFCQCIGFENSIDTWQKIVKVLSYILMIYNIVLSFSKPQFMQLQLYLAAGMLIRGFSDNYHRISRILRQLSILLTLSVLLIYIWLRIHKGEWYEVDKGYNIEKQIQGANMFNFCSYYMTVLEIPLVLILAFGVFLLSIKQQYQI